MRQKTNHQKKHSSLCLYEYKRFVQTTLSQYPCKGFEVLDKKMPSRFAILRHDIDFSPQRALVLAKIEKKLKVRATYTVLLSGEYYSPFERETAETLRKIFFLGHDIGLHFDAARHEIKTEAELGSALTWERQVLARVLGIQEKNIRMFSFHNTTPFTMNCKRSHYAGLRNAYAGLLQKDVQYISDSNGYWIYRSWIQLLLEKHPRIQVLTHPDWWVDKEAEPAEKICSAIYQRALDSWVRYRRLLKKLKRQNRTGLSNAPKILPKIYGQDGERLLFNWLAGFRHTAFFELLNKMGKKPVLNVLAKIKTEKRSYQVARSIKRYLEFIKSFNAIKKLNTADQASLFETIILEYHLKSRRK